MKAITTLPSLARASTDVCAEFTKLGLYTEALHGTDVFLSFLPWHYLENGHYADNAVTIPKVSASAAFGPYCSLRDTLRHEFGHALLDHHPELVTTAEWKSVFGARQHQPSPLEYGHEDFVTPYANTGSTVEEDFCESLMTWVRHQGSIGRYRYSRPGVHRKLKFIATLPQKVKALRLA
jgi:hypothetical protein